MPRVPTRCIGAVLQRDGRVGCLGHAHHDIDRVARAEEVEPERSDDAHSAPVWLDRDASAALPVARPARVAGATWTSTSSRGRRRPRRGPSAPRCGEGGSGDGEGGHVSAPIPSTDEPALRALVALGLECGAIARTSQVLSEMPSFAAAASARALSASGSRSVVRGRCVLVRPRGRPAGRGGVGRASAPPRRRGEVTANSTSRPRRRTSTEPGARSRVISPPRRRGRRGSPAGRRRRGRRQAPAISSVSGPPAAAADRSWRCKRSTCGEICMTPL